MLVYEFDNNLITVNRLITFLYDISILFCGHHNELYAV